MITEKSVYDSILSGNYLELILFTGNEVIDGFIWILIIAVIVISVIGLLAALSPAKTKREEKEVELYGSRFAYFVNQWTGLFLTCCLIVGIFVLTITAIHYCQEFIDYHFSGYSFYPLISAVCTFIVFCGVPALFVVPLFRTKFFARFRSMFGSDYNGVPSYTCCRKYVEDNKTKIGLFVRPAVSKYDITLANKYCVFDADLLTSSLYCMEYTVINKVNSEKTILKIFSNDVKQKQNLFFNVCKTFNYDTKADDIINIFEEIYRKRKTKTEHKNVKQIYLDVNSCSEAELTAIPGVTIAKAKHAVKVRNKMKFLTMNQFYKEIELDEEFIEQIPVKGNKIILNNLPEYQKLEMKKEE